MNDENFDDLDDFELSPEDIAKLERGMQDLNDGFGFEMIHNEDGEVAFKCLKCGREGTLHERPFPHRFDCAMRDRIKD